MEDWLLVVKLDTNVCSPFRCEQVRNTALSTLCGLYVLLLFHIIIKLNDLPLWYILNWEKIITILLQYTAASLLQMDEMNLDVCAKKVKIKG